MNRCQFLLQSPSDWAACAWDERRPRLRLGSTGSAEIEAVAAAVEAAAVVQVRAPSPSG